ncbi:MAG: GTPase Era [Fibrobacterota bacterium]
MDEQTTYSAFLALVGRPNSGKSTLINSIIGESLAAVSPLPQTTQKNMNGIYTQDNLQLVFVDTPGIHMGKHRLNKNISHFGLSKLDDTGIDIVCYMVDMSREPGAEEERIATRAARVSGAREVVIIFNKADLFTIDEAEKKRDAFFEAYPDLSQCRTIMLSAQAQDAAELFIRFLRPLIPEGPFYYPPDELTDSHLRYFAAEYVRMQIIGLTYREVPHASFVEITSYTEKEGIHYISADIHVETTGQKAILIGNKGHTIARIRRQAQWRMKKLTGGAVKYQLFVKVTPHWRDKTGYLKEFGFVE